MSSKDSTQTPVLPPEVLTLVERFENFRDDYLSKGGITFNETQLRREFLDPLFVALGWDVANTAGHAEAYKDVIHEDAIKIGGATKAPDYCFRIGGTRKFFLEAKKPSIDIKGDPGPAYQLRRYAWSAKLPLSILSDFEEFAVYDCRIRPSPSDQASTARIQYFTVDQLNEHWKDFFGVFSKKAILRGSLDRYAESSKLKRGTAEVDTAFLAEIERWRDKLARNLALRNSGLSQRDLNFAVQRTIDRIIFLRICEDRGIETYGTLLALTNGQRVYQRLFERFQRADERYNSGLFHFRNEDGRTEAPDNLTPALQIDDKLLRYILTRLYYPDSPYEFSVLPADILGQVYEQFLGKVIRLTKGHQAKVEEKPEVRKAGGVYYTPGYVVDYIVKHTVAKLVHGKTPQEVGGRTPKWRRSKTSHPVAILDPACGSGSFLLGAYQFLLDWHRDRYLEDGPEEHAAGKAPRLFQTATPAGGEWRLTTAERKRILLTHIFGVDIDLQAVETTKLSLLLKVLEGENAETLGSNLRLFHERALPDLGNNIKCGNSLIGSDFYDQQNLDLSDEDTRLRINSFDWNAEFKEITGAGGFDAVIGNPPYRREKDFKHLLDDIATTEFGKKYRAPRMDLWYYFVHRGLELLSDRGLLSFITNAYWVSGTGSTKLISALREEHHTEEIFFLGRLPVFAGVSGQHTITRLSRGSSQEATCVKLAQTRRGQSTQKYVRDGESVRQFFKDHADLYLAGKIDLEPTSESLSRCFATCTPLIDFGEVRQGIAENPARINRKTNEKNGSQWKVGEGVFVLTPGELARLQLPIAEQELLRPYHHLQDLGRYRIAARPSLTLIYSTRQTCPDVNAFPGIRDHLARFKSVMLRRRETKKGSNQWWHLHWPRDERIWLSPKVISIQMGARPAFVDATTPTYVPFSANVFVPGEQTKEDLHFFTAVLNSRLLWKWFRRHAKKRGVGLEINGNVLSRAPIRGIDEFDRASKARHDRLVSLVQSMLNLQEQLENATTAHAEKALRRQIDTTDRQIDTTVYEIYGLNNEQIAAVEAATA